MKARRKARTWTTTLSVSEARQWLSAHQDIYSGQHPLMQTMEAMINDFERAARADRHQLSSPSRARQAAGRGGKKKGARK